MNRRQWQVLALGTVATVLVPVLGTTWLHPPAASPLVEYAPGHYSQETTDAVAVTPTWALLVSLGAVTPDDLFCGVCGYRLK